MLMLVSVLLEVATHNCNFIIMQLVPRLTINGGSAAATYTHAHYSCSDIIFAVVPPIGTALSKPLLLVEMLFSSEART